MRAVFGLPHYVAFWNMLWRYPDFVECFGRYLFGRGEYPYSIRVRTPTGQIRPTLFTRHDMLTVNEVFCREDYRANRDIRVVVDVGANIGISALYFLTRNRMATCHLFEPDVRNVRKLCHNLTGFDGRIVLREVAVSDYSGPCSFGIEPTGRYGGIDVMAGERIEVESVHINGVLESILCAHDTIDILKLDTEGAEIRTVEAITKDLLLNIREIYLEARPRTRIHPTIFNQRQYGGVCWLRNKRMA